VTDLEILYEEAKLAFSSPKEKILDINRNSSQNKSLTDWVALWDKFWEIDYQLQVYDGKDANKIDKNIKEIFIEFVQFIKANSINANNAEVIYCKHRANEILGEVYFHSYKDKEIKGKTKENYLNKALDYLQQAVAFTPYMRRSLDPNKSDIYLLLAQEFVCLSKGKKITYPLETILTLLGGRDLNQPIQDEHDKLLVEVLADIYLLLSDMYSENSKNAWDITDKVNKSEENVKNATECYKRLKTYYEAENNIAAVSKIREQITQAGIITTQNQKNLVDYDDQTRCINHNSWIGKSGSKRRKLNAGERQPFTTALIDSPVISYVDRITNHVNNQDHQSSLSQAATSLVK
jgi:hypothetical protein